MNRTMTALIPVGAEPTADRFSDAYPWLPLSYAGPMRLSDLSPQTTPMVLWWRTLPEEAFDALSNEARQAAESASRLVT